MRHLARCIGVAGLLVLLAGCSDRQDNHYASYEEAKSVGAVEHGWVPDWLPADTGEIDEAHDIDTNRSMVRFALPDNKTLALPLDCVSTLPGKLNKPFDTASWWPAVLPSPGDTVHHYYRCVDEGQVAVDELHGLGYVWQ
ncbi:hypothetical protein QU487_03890 [Crenobacter sp. SG2305]|uniref:hypothetical protein n=1 Tax=Crenobacter oryzisoli TaxID=3056844 RepID=UPI0025AB2DB0|nr:hypothetical protein [Crenobacter sp. SG2305]MDN0081902.1 hypothetical protein [Crenobacter sp. SG2305]